ncbi:hypothetical protein M2171_004948 [Bradyrhizobium japonicum USDA 38]|uniref:hypothetical protein n=1 Tax=Bradyrhizobium japonicum TaxID=375 RepID=UPI0012BCED03|nr:hypothetical protein [Bradyrhizobium japonicum]MCS3895815.1 hypothetical protein [Bradyrhizobium japonicum USDA 38]MCS3948330.1 hypothetical protein [Bradyrhizobium japonicum]
MADQDVQVTGKSRYEVAHEIAIQILFNCEKKRWENISRKDLLHAVADAYDALGGYKLV